MLTVYHCDSNRTSHHPPRIIRGGFFHPFLLPPSHGQPTTASTSRDDSLVCRSVCQQPTTANKGQRRPTKMKKGPNNDRYVFFMYNHNHFILFLQRVVIP